MRTEKKTKLDIMVELIDIEKTNHYYKKEIFCLWGPLTALALIVLIAQIIEGHFFEDLPTTFIILAILACYVRILCKDWIKVEKMKKQLQKQLETLDIETPQALLQALRELLGEECEITPLEGCSRVEEITQTYLSAKAEGEQTGFFPVILQLNNNLIENIADELKDDPPVELQSGEMVIKKRIKNLRDCFNDEIKWNELIADQTELEGKAMNTMEGADIEWGQFVLVKIAVKKASEIFVKIPMGAWNKCPSAEEHQAIAQFWNEKYKAVPCFISSDVIMYNVPMPIGPDIARTLALEHTAYAPDLVMQGCDHISTLAKNLERSTFWYFWWD